MVLAAEVGSVDQNPRTSHNFREGAKTNEPQIKKEKKNEEKQKILRNFLNFFRAFFQFFDFLVWEVEERSVFSLFF